MSFKEERNKRDAYLYALYLEAKKAYPTSPESVIFGFSKTRSYNLAQKQLVDDDSKRGGYMIGERLGLTIDEVDAFIIRLANDGYMDVYIGALGGNLTSAGIRYLESLEEEPKMPFQVKQTIYNIGSVSGPVQIQHETRHSTQTQQVGCSRKDLEDIFALIRKDIAGQSEAEKKEITAEMDYALLQLDKGRSVGGQLRNIGAILGSFGLGTLSSLTASPLWEMMKAHFGF